MSVEPQGPPSAEDVRCLACHAVYELPVEVQGCGAPACPRCGAAEWLAATIPLPQTEPARAA